MDATDRKLLALLQGEGRLTFTELAERVHLSLSRVQRRVRDLEATGVITGYHAAVQPELVGFGFQVLAFATLSRPDFVETFDAALADVPQVIEAERLFGDPDYLIRVVAADLEGYQRLYDNTLSKLPGLNRLTSTIVMKRAVPARPLPTQ